MPPFAKLFCLYNVSTALYKFETKVIPLGSTTVIFIVLTLCAALVPLPVIALFNSILSMSKWSIYSKIISASSSFEILTLIYCKIIE